MPVAIHAHINVPAQTTSPEDGHLQLATVLLRKPRALEDGVGGHRLHLVQLQLVDTGGGEEGQGEQLGDCEDHGGGLGSRCDRVRCRSSPILNVSGDGK